MNPQAVKNHVRDLLLSSPDVSGSIGTRFAWGNMDSSALKPCVNGFTVSGPEPVLAHGDNQTTGARSTVYEIIFQVNAAAGTVSEATGIQSTIFDCLNGYQSGSIRSCFVRGERDYFEKNGNYHISVASIYIKAAAIKAAALPPIEDRAGGAITDRFNEELFQREA